MDEENQQEEELPNMVDLEKLFPQNFRSTGCHRENDGKIICDGIIDNQPAVCEITPMKDGAPQITCKVKSAV